MLNVNKHVVHEDGEELFCIKPNKILSQPEPSAVSVSAWTYENVIML